MKQFKDGTSKKVLKEISSREFRMEDGMRKKVIFTFLSVWMILLLTSCHARQPYDIRPGMTKEDVIRAWGGTYLPTHQIRDGKQVEVWEYRFANTGSVCRIVFYQDRVASTQCWQRVFRPWWY